MWNKQNNLIDNRCKELFHHQFHSIKSLIFQFYYLHFINNFSFKPRMIKARANFKPLLLILMFFALHSHCCNKFDSGRKVCLQCPQGTHIYKGNCIYDIDYCARYEAGVDCNRCENGYKLVIINERTECQKLQVKQNNDFFEQQIYIHHKDVSSTLGEDRIQFYDFLDNYLNKEYLQQHSQKRLLKIVDRLYKNGEHQVIMFYKTSKNVYKAIVSVINNYKSLEMKYFGNVSQDDIPDNQIIPLSSSESSHSQGVENQPNQTQISKLIQRDSSIKVDFSKLDSKSEQNYSNQDEITHASDINFEYQKPQNREKDIGFQTSDQYLKLANNKLLGQNAKVIGCFVKTSGLRKNYRIMYKAMNSQIYEGEVIYDVIKRRAYILNFGRQFDV